MMSLKIRIYSDFVCPFLFYWKNPLMEAVNGKDIEIEWMPFELRSYSTEPMSLNNECI
ncbi:hypothetical protein [Thermaerobacillus caldiproteolyticus]|nr:hypothetical protein [Anoxybacillus caldiproteolyticus]QPA31781.1 hypothetical protein ISX45_01845 [Anoxybacillus caldiproteolyticus]